MKFESDKTVGLFPCSVRDIIMTAEGEDINHGLECRV